MNYNVIWQESAMHALQRILDASHDVQGLKNTIMRIGIELGVRPHRAGESRDQGNRILFKFPLVVRYHVNERMKEVVIFDVRPIRR